MNLRKLFFYKTNLYGQQKLTYCISGNNSSNQIIGHQLIFFSNYKRETIQIQLKIWEMSCSSFFFIKYIPFNIKFKLIWQEKQKRSLFFFHYYWEYVIFSLESRRGRT